MRSVFDVCLAAGALLVWCGHGQRRMSRRQVGKIGLIRSERVRLSEFDQEFDCMAPRIEAALGRFLAIIISFFLSQPGLADGVSTEPVYGAGPSTVIATVFFEHFNQLPGAQGWKFEVPDRSVKHKGGIRASGQYLFGRTGRPLSSQEKALNKFEIPLGKIPVGFVTGNGVVLPAVNPEDINALFAGRISNWAELGGPDAPVVLVGREPSEAVLTVLLEHFPALADADYGLVLKRDHAVVNYLRTQAGRFAIAYGAISNFVGLNPVDVVGPPLGVDVGLVVDQEDASHPVVRSAQAYAASVKWRKFVAASGYLAIESSKPVRAPAVPDE